MADFSDSVEGLTDIVGYFEFYDDDGTAPLLCAVTLSFGDLELSVVAQEDDSFGVYREQWSASPEWTSLSLIERSPWSLAKGKPLLWCWLMVNQQGYLDGLQIEFARSSEDQSVVVQLVAIGSEVKQRMVESQCRALA